MSRRRKSPAPPVAPREPNQVEAAIETMGTRLRAHTGGQPITGFAIAFTLADGSIGGDNMGPSGPLIAALQELLERVSVEAKRHAT